MILTSKALTLSMYFIYLFYSVFPVINGCVYLFVLKVGSLFA